MHALNVIYGVEERRGRVRRLVTSLLVSALTLSLFVVALVLIVAGARFSEALADGTGLGISYELAWTAAAWLVIVLAVTAGFALTYYFAPDVDQRLRWVRAGSVFGVVTWLLFTGLFAVYVKVVSQPSETYGSLAGVAFFMVYVYGAAFILLLGATTNQVIEAWEPEGKDAGQRKPNGG
jgi:membrane protein